MLFERIDLHNGFSSESPKHHVREGLSGYFHRLDHIPILYGRIGNERRRIDFRESRFDRGQIGRAGCRNRPCHSSPESAWRWLLCPKALPSKSCLWRCRFPRSPKAVARRLERRPAALTPASKMEIERNEADASMNVIRTVKESMMEVRLSSKSWLLPEPEA